MDGLIVKCAGCGAKNRKNPLRSGDNPVCARCGYALPRGGGPLALNELTFDPVLRAQMVPIVVDFWAEWCQPCKAFAPMLDAFAAGHQDDVLVAKVNADENPVIASKFAIRSIPTVILFRGPIEVARQVGIPPTELLNAWAATGLG